MVKTLTTREILDHLVSFPTVSSDTNLPLIEWVEGYLTSYGITCHRQAHPTENKFGLFASVGPDAPGGVILSGHTDVVPVEGQPWTSDPWTVTERDGKLYGRGTCDMKGFDALAVAAMVEATQHPLKRPLQIALTYDEEVGCLGAPPLIEAMQGVVPRAEAVIVGEPSMMKVVTGHKGGTGWIVDVKGHEVHSSLIHEGVNAIMEGAKLIALANDINAANAAERPSVMAADFTPPWTSAHVGQIAGGTAHNITAGACQFGFDFRVVPGETLDQWRTVFHDRVAEIEAGMQAIAPGTGITATEFFAIPGLAPEQDGPAEALARQLTGDNGTHVVSYGTEAGQFQEAGYSAVVCGPGDIAQAHQADEYITIDQYQAGWTFLQRLIDRLAS